MSFELERRAKQQALAEKPSCSYHPTISFETPMESMEASVETMDVSTTVEDTAEKPLVTYPGAKPKMSRSFEQPPLRDRPRPERLANSLDVSFSFDRRSSIPEEDKDEDKDRASPIYINMEETKITAPLLESLKSSDV
ncbi:unnamed protein product [Acanthoscelides obtectus]|nr:unnamed protein product [Acanthoscelides obtectus]CAK1626655.1 hypothetical protein AOBTE_LOCUS4008 [Acanthoscelides obtectus]